MGLRPLLYAVPTLATIHALLSRLLFTTTAGGWQTNEDLERVVDHPLEAGKCALE